MQRARVHYEIAVRRSGGAGWTLDAALEDRAAALRGAEQRLADGGCVAVRVTKEVMREDSGEFSSAVILERAAPEAEHRKARRAGETRLPAACSRPQDLYAPPARAAIARVLEGWLARREATATELLHRADLIAALEADETDRLHALQKASVAQAQGSGRPVHEVLKPLQALVTRASERVKTADFPDLSRERPGAAATRLASDPQGAWRLTGAVCAVASGAGGWSGKLDRLLDLGEAALADGPTGAPALMAIEGLLIETLESEAGRAGLIGAHRELGNELAAMARLAGLDGQDGSGVAGRLARFFRAGGLPGARRVAVARVLAELDGPRRFRPSSPRGEVEAVRAWGALLAAAPAGLVEPETLRRAMGDRWRRMLAPDFTAPLVEHAPSVLAEAETLAWLAEGVVGGANRRSAARLLGAVLSGHRLEREIKDGESPPAARLAALARLQRSVAAFRFEPEETATLTDRIGALGGLVETRARLVASLLKADAEPRHKLFLLFKLATGESAPYGPVTELARAEAMRLMRTPDLRAELAASPELRARLTDLMPSLAA